MNLAIDFVAMATDSKLSDLNKWINECIKDYKKEGLAAINVQIAIDNAFQDMQIWYVGIISFARIENL